MAAEATATPVLICGGVAPIVMRLVASRVGVVAPKVMLDSESVAPWARVMGAVVLLVRISLLPAPVTRIGAVPLRVVADRTAPALIVSGPA